MALLLQSDPAQDTVLKSPPSLVHMWFSEDLNPTFSTAQVIGGSSMRRVDLQDAHVSSSNTREMDLSLQQMFPPRSILCSGGRNLPMMDMC
jgi:copper transport protein